MKNLPPVLVAEENIVAEFSSVKSLPEILELQKQMLDQAVNLNHVFDKQGIIVTFMDTAINQEAITQRQRAACMGNGHFLRRHLDKIILAPPIEDIIRRPPIMAIQTPLLK